MKAIARWAMLVIALLGAPRLAVADSLDARFEQALRDHEAGRHEVAAASLRELVRLGIEDPDVYLDLGVAEADATRYGHAMVAFERCLGLRPGDPVASRGLDLAETMLARRRAEATGRAESVDQRGALVRFGRTMREATASYGLVASVWLMTLGVLALVFARRESARIGSAVIATTGVLASAFFGLAVVGRARPAGQSPAIVVVPELESRSAPDPRAPPVGRFVEGERVDVIETRGAYVRIAVDGRPRGFAPRASVGTY